MNQTVTWSPVSRDSTIESSSQLLPILYGSDMMNMVDGTTSAPSETLMVDSKTVPNPAYLEWKKKDQILLSWLHITMRPTVFAQVIGYKTARSTWEALDRAYTSQTNARYYQIKHYLFNYQIKHYLFNIRVHISLRNIWIVSAGSQMNYLLFNNQWVIDKFLVVFLTDLILILFC